MKTARMLVVDALLRQEQNGYSNLVLDSELKKSELSAQDKAFAGVIFYGVLERQNTLDFCLQGVLKKPTAKLDAPVRAILRSGLYQLQYMSVPASAAVNESVKLTRVFGKSSAAGLVNAVLRRAGGLNPENANFKNNAQRISILYSVSLPIAELFIKAYGSEAEEILGAFFVRSQTAIRPNLLKTDLQTLQEQLEKSGVKTEIGKVPGALEAVFFGSPAEHPAFHEGLFYVQGQPSQLAAISLGVKPGETVLDLCAAPGGKSLTIAGMMQNEGVLYSCDVSPGRVPLITRAFARCGVTIGRVMQNDASVPNLDFPPADRILCDVPCSGLGILGKKPDIRYKQLDGIEKLIELQETILQTAAGYLKNGGTMVYSTCTLNPQENKEVVKKFLSRQKEFSAVEPIFVPKGALRDECGGMTLLPNRCGMDGFYIACLKKTD